MTDIERRLEQDLVVALRSRAPELGVLRMLKAALQNERIAKQAKEEGLGEAEVWAVLRRELKRRQEAAGLYEQGGRAELAQSEQAEAQVVSRYLPPAPAVEQVREVMENILREQNLSGPQAIGALTKATLAYFGGALDGQTASQLARELLSQP
ncbi:MAG: GatB/YqeY domain-containing protein [Candidatus Veblenbacteria bacterium]|nr:GatB/YqeY domain-containing protein [Candidatus Veblenbacteria bacterium]MDZ4230074.1 GatB/YqeY domain-containing protein [Candidatus Veblenbacteria bacterium]